MELPYLSFRRLSNERLKLEDQYLAEPIPASKRKIVDAQIHNGTGGRARQSHDAAQDRRARGLYPQASCESGSSFAAGSQPNRSNVLTATNRHSGPRLDKGGESLSKDFL